MAIYKISEDHIREVKKKRLFFIISAIIVISVIAQANIYFTVTQDIKVFLFSLGIYIVAVALALLFIIKFTLKSFEKTMRSTKYTLENERLIMTQNGFEQFNITKDEIKCINKHKNNLIEIILKNNKKILVNRYLEKYDELLVELKQLSEINETGKNPYINKNIFAAIMGIIVMGIYFFSKNIYLVIISSVLLFIFCLYLFIINFKKKNIDTKKRIMIYLLLPITLILIIQRIIELL